MQGNERVVAVSVIIPFFRNTAWLLEALRSVFEQSFQDFELILINDGSPEDMSCVLDKFDNRIRYFHQENRGAAYARNYGITVSKGQYIAFLDADDLWEKNKLEKQTYYMNQFDAIWSYSSWETFGKATPKKYLMTKNKKANFANELHDCIATPAVMVRRDFLEKHTDCRFCESLRFGEDVYFWLMLRSYAPPLVIPEILTRVRIHGNNASGSAVAQLNARCDLWKIRNENPDRLIYPFSISSLYRFAIKLSILGKKIYDAIFRRIMYEPIQEFMAGICYLLPWICFQIDKIQSRKTLQ